MHYSAGRGIGLFEDTASCNRERVAPIDSKPRIGNDNAGIAGVILGSVPNYLVAPVDGYPEVIR